MRSTAPKKKKPPTQAASCCSPSEVDQQHPDHTEFTPRLNRVGGQLSGIQKMIDDRRYCVDILVQFRAVMAALRSIEVSIFEKHLEHCVKDALLSKDKKQVAGKIKELTELLSRRTTL